MFQHLRQRHAIGLQLAIGVWGAQPFGATAGVCGRRALAQCALYFGAPIIHQADMVQVQPASEAVCFAASFRPAISPVLW